MSRFKRVKREKRARRWDESTHVKIACAATFFILFGIFFGFHWWGNRYFTDADRIAAAANYSKLSLQERRR